MRHAAPIWAGALAAACLPLAAAAQDAPARTTRPAPVPKYNWIQADYVSSYLGEGEGRIASEGGYEISTHLLLAKPFYFTGSFGNQAYDFAEGTAAFSADDTAWSAGFGGFVPLAPSVHLTLAGTWEAGEYDEANKLTGARSKDKADGYGLELGVRAQVTPSAELAGSYKFRDQDVDGSGASAEREGHTFAAGVIANLTPMIGLALKMERSALTDTDTGGKDSFSEERYSIGLRFRL